MLLKIDKIIILLIHMRISTKIVFLNTIFSCLSPNILYAYLNIMVIYILFLKGFNYKKPFFLNNFMLL